MAFPCALDDGATGGSATASFLAGPGFPLGLAAATPTFSLSLTPSSSLDVVVAFVVSESDDVASEPEEVSLGELCLAFSTPVVTWALAVAWGRAVLGAEARGPGPGGFTAAGLSGDTAGVGVAEGRGVLAIVALKYLAIRRLVWTSDAAAASRYRGRVHPSPGDSSVALTVPMAMPARRMRNMWAPSAHASTPQTRAAARERERDAGGLGLPAVTAAVYLASTTLACRSARAHVRGRTTAHVCVQKMNMTRSGAQYGAHVRVAGSIHCTPRRNTHTGGLEVRNRARHTGPNAKLRR